ncbi:MAG TPA: hypothetical protein PKI35_06820 [Bacteroidales bacterium]|nr:hypothetical protein [Bacteroidales bacterium]
MRGVDKNTEAPTGQDGGFNNALVGKRQRKDTAFQALSALYLKENIRKYPSLPYRCVPKWNDCTSNGLTRMIIDFLRLSGHQAERISNTGRMLDGRKIVVDCIGNRRLIGSTAWIPGTGSRGTADISATINGRSAKIEVKCQATKDKQRPAQAEYQKQIEAAGGTYYVAQTFAGFFNWYNKTFGGANQ